jgi:hypothetical protein
MNKTYLRLSLLENGFHPIPILDGTKRPALRNWNNFKHHPSENEIRQWEMNYPNASGTGILCGEVVAIDIDVLDETLVTKIRNMIFNLIGEAAPERQGKKPKTCLLFQSKKPIKKRSTSRFGTVFSQNHQVEVLGIGQQIIVDHIHPDTNQSYIWLNHSLENLKYDELPEITPAQIDKILIASENVFKDAGLTSDKEVGMRTVSLDNPCKNDTYPSLTGEDIKEILAFYPNTDLHYDDWIRVAMCLNSWGGENGRAFFERWSAQSSKNNAEFTSNKYGQCSNPASITMGSLIHLAKQNGFRFKPKSMVNPKNQIDVKKNIQMHSGQTHQILNQFETAMRQSSLEFYRFNGQLVEVINDITGKTENKFILFHDKDTLIDRLGIIIQGYKFSIKSGEWYPADPSLQLVRSLIARTKMSLLPRIRAFTQCPYIQKNGQITSSSGYNPETEIYLLRDVQELTSLPETPTKHNAGESLDYLKGFLSGFPFASGNDLSVALSALLSAVNKVNLDNIPLHAFNAPTAGTGKSLLADVIALITTGNTISVMSQGKDEVETEKRLHSAMLAGDTIISMDNCDEPLGGDVLCQILTQPAIRIRPLGASKLVDAQKSCMILATGNNMIFEGDITRRTLVCTLDAKMERPETRKFDFDAKEQALLKRDDIIFHCLMILKASKSHLSNPLTIPLGSFEEWSRQIRDTLVWLGFSDPVNSQKNIRSTDPTFNAQQDLLDALRLHFGEEKFKTRDVLNSRDCRRDQRFTDALDTLGCISRGEISPASLGKNLNKLNNRIINGLQLIKVSQSGNAVDWKISAIG